jgi:UDP:flavonoid glycosyltransferase YjiC (YdhE family)
MLFCFVGGPGHFEPLRPLAETARAAGHTVAVACGRTLVPFVEAAGFRAFGIGPAPSPGPRRRLPLQEIDPESAEREVRERLVEYGARIRAAGILPLASEWEADVVVADEADLGGTLAAEELDLPYATVLVLAAGSLIRPGVVGDTLDRVRAEHGLAPDPALAAPGRYLVLSPFPPSLRDPDFPPPPTTHFFRPVDARAAGDGPPPWPRHLADAPSVYFTLGTEFNLESGDLFTRVVAGLRQLPANVLVTVGSEIDPAELGPQPANVHVERYLAQADVLPHCDLVVFHAGSGTLTGALAHGLPLVLLPMGADQPANAERCESLGLGVTLDVVRATPAEVRDAAASVLADPARRRAAQRLGDEIAALPDPATAVALLERLAAERRPIRAG